MFENLMARGRALAERRARTRAAELSERMAKELPLGATASAEAEGVVIRGRGVARRFALETAFRSMVERLR